MQYLLFLPLFVPLVCIHHFITFCLPPPLSHFVSFTSLFCLLLLHSASCPLTLTHSNLSPSLTLHYVSSPPSPPSFTVADKPKFSITRPRRVTEYQEGPIPSLASPCLPSLPKIHSSSSSRLIYQDIFLDQTNLGALSSSPIFIYWNPQNTDQKYCPA